MSSNNDKFYTVIYTETTSRTYRNTIKASSQEEAEDIIINRRPLPYVTEIVSEVSDQDADREIVFIGPASTEVNRDDFSGPIF